MAESPPSAIPRIVSPRFDCLWFVGPGLVAAIWALLEGLGTDAEATDTPVGLWILGILLVDVAHVWSSLFRTYFDPTTRATLGARLLWTPLLCAWFGILLHVQSPALFWRVLAYVAIFHFIKQHVGFVRLFARAGGESLADARLATITIWASTLGPIVWWHAHLPRAFAWFRDGDLIAGAPSWIGAAAVLAQVPVWIAFLRRRRTLRRVHGRRNPTLLGHALVVALNWNLGIVVFNDDRVFTITNVFLHGVPYLALVWVAGGRTTLTRHLGVRPWPVLVAAYYGIVVALAYGEEWLWDRSLWHDHPTVFGDSTFAIPESSWLGALLVGLLATPQATHYILDRWIWRVGPHNPGLARALGFTPAEPK